MSEQKTYRINQFIAKCGVCTRREADQLIKQSLITVNDHVVKEFGLKIDPLIDAVMFDGRVLTLNQGRFLLFNKPAGMPMSSADTPEVISAASIVARKTAAIMHPLSSLESQDCGLVLFTDDLHAVGMFEKRLDELIHVTLHDCVSADQLKRIRATPHVLEVSMVKTDVEIGIHVAAELSGKVRGILESMGCKVQKYDRVMISNLTKRDLPRTRSRILNEKDLGFLKMSI